MNAFWNDILIAESDDTQMVAKSHCFPLDSITDEYSVSSDTTSHCFGKDTENDYSLNFSGQQSEDAVLHYVAAKESVSRDERFLARR